MSLCPPEVDKEVVIHFDIHPMVMKPPDPNTSEVVETVAVSPNRDLPDAKETAVATLDPVVLEVVESVLNNIMFNIHIKCKGFVPPQLGDTLACHLLPKLDIVIGNSSLHHDNCAKNEYQSFDGRLVNKCCSDLKYSPKLKKLIDRGMKIYSTKDMEISSCHNNLFSHDQLCEKATNLQVENENFDWIC